MKYTTAIDKEVNENKKEYYKIIGNKIDENLSDFEKIARKSKRRNRIKTIFISSIVALLSLGLIMKIMTL